ncbi:patatin-like phospholipase family protein [Zoogloea sp.]|uniref:patatin-like phospholipase family protein n=1 Tax=Zoogloea sp. TaxID=49181 RepID=UPI0035AF606E
MTATASSPSPKAPGRVPGLAIACQGGGAHTAFTAGVLAYLFLSFEHFRRRGEDGQWFELLGLSGTSGGAITAAMAWSEAPDGSWAEGARRVLRYWNRNKASLDGRGKLPIWWGEFFSNAASQWAMSLQDWLPSVSTPPSPFLSSLVQARMKDDMRAVVKLPDGADRFHGRPGLDLFVGAVDVVNPGDEPQSAFRTFPERPGEGLRLDELLASACIPELFIATPLSVRKDDGSGGRETRLFWDGLYSQNPPIDDFFSGRPRMRKPDLLWIVQINPNRYEGGDGGPLTPDEQADRRNELAGNLSLGQELRAIDTVNRIAFELAELPRLEGPLAEYKPVTVCFIRLAQPETGPLSRFRLDYASKLDRDPAFIDALIGEGVRAAHRAAIRGELVRPHACMTEVCAFAYRNPAWPTPAELVELLDDATLAAQWRGLIES